MKDRRGVVALVDMLKEAILRTGCLDTIKEMSRAARLSPETLAERLLLVLYAYIAGSDVVRDRDRERHLRREGRGDLGRDLDDSRV